MGLLRMAALAALVPSACAYASVPPYADYLAPRGAAALSRAMRPVLCAPGRCGQCAMQEADALESKRPMVGSSPPIDRSDPSKVAKGLSTLDRNVLNRVVRLANHAPALASLSYFGLISMTMLSMSGPSMMATFRAVITRGVGPTTNQAFAAMFPTLVTPASFVFLIWPLISVLQLATLGASALRTDAPPMRQAELSALTLANVFATCWLLVSSNSAAGALPLASALTIPLVALFAGYPLRAAEPPSALYRPVFQVFSSFTTIASFLALAVELQFGGRLGFLLGRAEIAGCAFVGLTAGVVSLPRRSLAKRAVNVLALTGVLARRVAVASAAGTGVGGLVLSASFVGTVAAWGWAVRRLAKAD